MNKVVAILGVIVLITLGALFFCAGFFTGSTLPSMLGEKKEVVNNKNDSDNKMSTDSIEAKIRAKSDSISEKIMKILATGTETVKNSISNSARSVLDNPNLSSETLLKEIIASHTTHDNCSVQKTEADIQNIPQKNPDSLQSKTIVFIGYFKNDIALQIQKLLIGKGYKVHIEQSKAAVDESFIFAGPFKKNINAEKLAKWLQQHSFSEAKVINVMQNSMEKMMADPTQDKDALPENEEKDIPEISNAQINALQNAARAGFTPQNAMPNTFNQATPNTFNNQARIAQPQIPQQMINTQRVQLNSQRNMLPQTAPQNFQQRNFNQNNLRQNSMMQSQPFGIQQIRR